MRQITKGSTSVTVEILIRDSTVTTGAGKTGLAFNTAGLKAYYVRNKAASVAITLVTQTAAGAYSSGGFVEIDATNNPGLYRLDVPNAAFVTGADSVTIQLSGATGMVTDGLTIQLIDVNLNDAVRLGLTALPNAAIDTVGGLYSGVQESGTAQAGAAGSITLRAGASATDNAYKSQMVKIISGTGAGQRPVFITGYTGASKVAAVSPNFITTPDLTSVYAIGNFGIDLPTDTQIAAAVWNELASGHTTAGTYGQIMQPIRTGTAQAGAANSITLDAGANATNEFYTNTLVRIVSGTGAGQSRYIASYTGATKVAVVNGNWITNPDNTSAFVILNGAAIVGASAPSAATVAAAVWDEIASGHTVVGSFGQVFQPVRTATAQSGGASTITLDASASATDNFYRRDLIKITAGTGLGQAREIVSYVGATKVATVSEAWTTAPDASSVFAIISSSTISLGQAALDSILDNAIAEPSSIPGWPASLRKIQQLLGALAQNPATESVTGSFTLRNYADAANIGTSNGQDTDDGTTSSRKKLV